MNEKIYKAKKAFNVQALKTFENTTIWKEIPRLSLEASAPGAGAVQLLFT